MKVHGALVALAVLLVSFAATGTAGGAGGKNADPLDMYRATVDAAQAAALGRDGYDVASLRQTEAGTQVDLVLSTSERDRLESRGIKLGLIRNDKGQTVRQQAALQAAG